MSIHFYYSTYSYKNLLQSNKAKLVSLSYPPSSVVLIMRYIDFFDKPYHSSDPRNTHCEETCALSSLCSVPHSLFYTQYNLCIYRITVSIMVMSKFDFLGTCWLWQMEDVDAFNGVDANFCCVHAHSTVTNLMMHVLSWPIALHSIVTHNVLCGSTYMSLGRMVQVEYQLSWMYVEQVYIFNPGAVSMFSVRTHSRYNIQFQYQRSFHKAPFCQSLYCYTALYSRWIMVYSEETNNVMFLFYEWSINVSRVRNCYHLSWCVCYIFAVYDPDSLYF